MTSKFLGIEKTPRAHQFSVSFDALARTQNAFQHMTASVFSFNVDLVNRRLTVTFMFTSSSNRMDDELSNFTNKTTCERQVTINYWDGNGLKDREDVFTNVKIEGCSYGSDYSQTGSLQITLNLSYYERKVTIFEHAPVAQ